MIGEQLRTAAIATKMRLDPDIHKIDNSELVELKKIIGVDEITLFARQGDDIVGLKSSDPKEIGVSSKGWDTIFVAFNQPLSRQEVNVGIGQTLRDYWSGPRDTSTTNPAQVNKWGYYYDGTTNYIIDPFVSVTGFKQYQDVTGVDDAIHRLLRDNGEAALEVSVLNSDKLLQRKLPEINPTPSNWFSEREVLFGSYEYRDPEEKQYAEAALNENRTVYYITRSGGKSVMKSFSPVHTDYMKYNAAGSPLLIEITSDYDAINQVLKKHLSQTVAFMILCTCLVLAIMALILWLFKKNKESALQDVQDIYVENIEALFQSIREQRHDFINHIQTIHGFLTLKHYDDLHKYTKSLVGEVRAVNELINIKDPALIALMQAKISQAETRSIPFEYDFKHMDQLKLGPVKATDIVKILSNLIDNAFDATCELETEARKVEVTGDVRNKQLLFTVANAGPTIPKELQTKIFQSGYSTKSAGTNSGLGLHIVKRLVERYKGTIQVTSEDGFTRFSVQISLG
ncbi:GHKL domain-containing protein [Paenibacillus sp. P26]|nr:GHKL domain-containing protein [Paenibacillus sp. P26]